MTSGEVESCLIRTATPALTWLKGQRKGWVQPLSYEMSCECESFTVAKVRLIETPAQAGLYRLLAAVSAGLGCIYRSLR